MDKQKFVLLDAYTKKAVAISKLFLIESVSNKDASIVSILDDIDKIYSEVGKFIDYTDTKVKNKQRFYLI